MALSPLIDIAAVRARRRGGYGVSALRLCHPASAESIRVLLAQEAPFLDVRSDGAFAWLETVKQRRCTGRSISLPGRWVISMVDVSRAGRSSFAPSAHLTLVIGKRRRGGAQTPLPISGAVRVSRKGMRWRSQTRLTWKSM